MLKNLHLEDRKSEFPASHRQREILDELRRSGGSMRIRYIAEALKVSEETVRRNIKILVDAGIVEKLYGGARLLDGNHDGNFQERFRENPEAKKRIARHVASMIPNKCSISLDIGSTTAHIADALCNHSELLIITNSVYVAFKLATRNRNRVFMAGGELRGHDGGTFGADAMSFAANFHTDYAILSTAAINSKQGFMLFDLDEAKYSRCIIENASVRIIAADSSKFGRVAPVTGFDPFLIDCLVTDCKPPADILKSLQNWDIKLEQTKSEVLAAS